MELQESIKGPFPLIHQLYSVGGELDVFNDDAQCLFALCGRFHLELALPEQVPADKVPAVDLLDEQNGGGSVAHHVHVALHLEVRLAAY